MTTAPSAAGPAPGPAGSASRGTVFRPRSAFVAAVVGLLAACCWAWLAVADAGVAGLLHQAPRILLAGTLTYAVLVRPAVEVGPAGVTLRNVLRDVDMPWVALAEVRTRFALTLVATDGRVFTAWAAPAPGRHSDTRLTTGELASIGWDPSGDLPSASASAQASSGAVAAWVRREWRSAAEAGASSCERTVRTSPARGVLASLCVAVVLTMTIAVA